MRSRTGCLTCRNRKLKCDEQKPVCGQCTKANRNCVASPGVVFRHQQNASLNGDIDTGGQSLKSFYGYKETFGKDSVWVEVPKQLTFINTTNPYEDLGSARGSRDNVPLQTDRDVQSSGLSSVWQPSATYSTPHLTAHGSTHGLEALSAAASGDHYLQTLQPSRQLSELAQTAAAQQASYVFDPAGSLSPPIDPQLNNDTQQFANFQGPSDIDASILDDQVKADDDVPFLLRYFSEGPGAWMDLFDLNSFFAVDVPVKASSCPLLLYAAIALSAKALGRIRISAQYIKQSASKQTPARWSHKAAYYYDLAIGLLRQALMDGTKPDSSRMTSETMRSPGSAHSARDSFPRWRDSNAVQAKAGSLVTDSDELVATTAILCVYEFLDASGLEWSSHLDGAKSLFDIATDGTLPLAASSPGLALVPSSSRKGRRAVFWNVCRQEMIDAFINNKQTRLDTSDLNMWRSVGLHISPTGYILPSNQPEVQKPMADDMISNALIWLIMKLVNFIAAGDDFPHELGLGIRQVQLLDYWEGLEKQLDIWHEGLPDSFRPTSTVWPETAQVEKGQTVNIPKKWFARAMCASTMQSFHFAKIQLLANKPHLSTGLPYTGLASGTSGSPYGGTTSSLAQRHASYATILHQSRKHAEDIVSIGLALSNDSARIHSVQPLYTAGQVLGNGDEGTVMEGGRRSSKTVDDVRICILNLLQGIQRETGWATEYRMRHLLEQWGLPAASESSNTPKVTLAGRQHS